MLVLSRGNNDKVVFPTLGITVEILRIAGKKVRLGIAAPKEIPVHRHEIAERSPEPPDCDNPSDRDNPPESRPRLSHAVRNRLHTASLALHVLGRQLELEETTEAEAVIFRILNELKAIESELEGQSAEPPSRRTARQYRALIVEDDDNERELLSGFLEMSGFSVDTAVDGIQAMVQLTKGERPDVVLLDMMMPRFDGSKTVSAIRCNPAYRGLRVFAVSGSDREEMNVALGENGVNRWFAKPIDPRTLVAAIREELARERAATPA